MDERHLYEKQYTERKLVSHVTFPTLRRFFRNRDITREDLAVDLLDSLTGRVLDIGCGEGSLLLRLTPLFSQPCGVDLTFTRLREAHGRLRDCRQATLVAQCNLNLSLPFKPNSFDAVTCLSVMEHLFDPYGTMAEIHRILKPRGTLVLEVPNIAYVKYRLQILFGQLPVTSAPDHWEEIGWDGGHLHYFTKARLEELCRVSGFSVEGVTGAGLLAKWWNWWPSLLTGDICIKASAQKTG